MTIESCKVDETYSVIVDDVKDNLTGLWIKDYSVAAHSFRTRSHSRWNSMKLRCIVGGRWQRLYPTYVGCVMSGNFKDFQYFTNWHREQVGYGIQGYQLDKDILVGGNKTYSEDVCVLVPQELNKFLCARGSSRGVHPQGVCFHKHTQTFHAQISIGGKRVSAGYYYTLEKAVEAYKVAKEAEARRWYKRLLDREFTVDGRVVERMRTWTFEERLNVV